MDDKAEVFVECLLGDIFGCYTEILELDVKFPIVKEGKRYAPEIFYSEMVSFCRVFVDELLPDLANLPVLFYYSELFFRRFTNSVCLKLIEGDDPEVAFLKVVGFLQVIIASSFVNRCYRSLDDVPAILHKLLKEHLKTNFYKEERWDDILEQCRELRDEEWYTSTLEEVRCHMKNALNAEFAPIVASHSHFPAEKFKTTILEVRLQRPKSDDGLCPYCATNCIFFLKAFWSPKVVYKNPECDDSG